MSSSTPFLQQAFMFLSIIFPSTTVSYFTGRELWLISFNLLIFHHVASFSSGFSFLSKTDTPVSFVKTDGFIFPPDSSILYLIIFLFQTRTWYKGFKGKNTAVLTIWICKHPNPSWRIATKAEKKNPQGYKDHIIRSSDDIFKPAAEYNNEAKLRSDHKQKPEFSWNAEIGVDAIFDMTADSKQNVEDHKAVKNQ